MRALSLLVTVLGVAAFCASSFQSQTPPGRGLSSPANPRALDERLRVLVPAYFYPLPGSPWPRLSAAAAAHPGRIAAIGDPFNGPGPAFDASYDAVFRDLRASGGQLIGYVYTSYGARPLAAVKADIDTWYAWYGIDGIFVDEMDNTPGAHEGYYRELYRHAKSHQPGALVVSNPGPPPRRAISPSAASA